MSEMKGKKEGTKEIVGPGPPPGPGPFPPVPLSHPAEYSIPALRHKFLNPLSLMWRTLLHRIY